MSKGGKTMKLFRFNSKEQRGKCNHCNWEVSYLYVLADTIKEAEKLFYDQGFGLCGDCMADLLSEDNYTITL